MKKTAIAAALLCLAAGFSFPAFSAEDDQSVDLTGINQAIDDHDPCTVFLCMAGKLKGENPSECHGPQKTFFNIVKKKKGHFNPSRTLNARKAFLGNCPSAPGDIVEKILSKYGKKRG
ncbi:hypothetical protein SNO15_004458 [Salmonella enterica]|nr:hypothetical protein [Salmonella enterica subsp. enterica serovar Give]EED4548143.1 hypothetical protein [Salmonella enterica subsp. enterica serovar Give]ELY6001043.1 hypothetical protein [Salmonella enterica]